jgi:hypothetical protein
MTPPEPGSFLAGRLEGVLEGLSACVELARVAELLKLPAQDVREAIEALRDRTKPVEIAEAIAAPSEIPETFGRVGDVMTYCRSWIRVARYLPDGLTLLRVYCHLEPKHDAGHEGSHQGKRVRWDRQLDEHERLRAEP